MNNLLKQLAPYNKAIVAFITGVLGIVAVYISLTADGNFSPEDQLALIAAISAALGNTAGVYTIANKPNYPSTK